MVITYLHCNKTPTNESSPRPVVSLDKGPSENLVSFRNFLKAILRCSPSDLRSLLQDGMFQSWKKVWTETRSQTTSFLPPVSCLGHSDTKITNSDNSPILPKVLLLNNNKLRIFKWILKKHKHPRCMTAFKKYFY